MLKGGGGEDKKCYYRGQYMANRVFMKMQR